jgi:hypothetical protein
MSRLLVPVPVALLLAATVLAQGEPQVMSKYGHVLKVDKESLTIQPRAPGGMDEKTMTLKITGTSKITVVSKEKRGGKFVPVQREVAAKDLQAGQRVAFIYTIVNPIGKDAEAVLLSAVAQPADKK